MATTTTTTDSKIKEKIESITESCRPYINKILKDLSIKNFENANIICDYIIAEQIEFNIKPTTKNGKIKSPCVSIFCLENNLIPFLNLIKIYDKTLIAITSDLIHELKQKISQLSSLNEIASIIDGFTYGQKQIGGKNTKLHMERKMIC